MVSNSLYATVSLLVADIFGRSLPIEGQDPDLPLDRNRGRQKADLTIASLIVELARDRQGFPIRAQQTAELRRGAYLHVLTDAKSSLENRNSFVDRRHIKHFRPRVNRR